MDNIQAIKQRFGIIGHSPQLQHALKTAIQVAATDLSVLVLGQSGVGKESFSKIIHQLSNRKHNNFIAINCGALPESTINSELFGHTKGAFTGAVNERKGYFETVNGGTIFLDEIGEMPLDTQTYLLRVLEQGEFVKVGSSQVEKTDVRIVAATNVNLLERIEQGKFREDLYYRLSTVVIQVPELHKRGDDVLLLFRKFVSDFADQYHTPMVRLTEEAEDILLRYPWPGNIRELRNVAKRAALFSEDKTITAEQLLEFLPQLGQKQRHLPLPHKEANDSSQGFYEREILFKFLYEMKQDLNDVKQLIAELVQTNNLQMPRPMPKGHSMQGYLPLPSPNSDNYSSSYPENTFNEEPRSEEGPIILNKDYHNQEQDRERYNEVEELEESLSMEQMERELIERALKKHRGKRKDAAQELGISERTLYRKIKLHDIQS
ncbi:sigma-54 interaction domain-containing protein [Saprospira grandis]|uniref:Sigma54 specific transcriptional regulator, Fis family protein n=1 Tax=Saprospira grandis (strain Lewin) TaxID=984262 RepID=H6L5L2_SAPGL|nr:sigma-54 dependent transcriptional regulator [Saprospira grandis]AFC25228.1 sigma54 specific transcriptional regulator, Fis family protein [Saprospira grandis str. Lewin]